MQLLHVLLTGYTKQHLAVPSALQYCQHFSQEAFVLKVMEIFVVQGRVLMFVMFISYSVY